MSRRASSGERASLRTAPGVAVPVVRVGGRATTGVTRRPESLDLERDLVAGLQVAAERLVADLEQAAGRRPCRCR